MKRLVLSLSKKSAIIIIAIISVAAVLSIGSFLSYSYTSTNLTNSAIRAIQANTQTEASDMSNIIAGKLELVATTLVVLSSSDALTTHNLTEAQFLFDTAQNSTNSFTYAYFWIDKSGRIVDSSNLTYLIQAQEEGVNVSQSPYFVGAEKSGTTYFSTLLLSEVTDKQIISVAQPIYSEKIVNGQETRVFNGILSASILVASIRDYVLNQLSLSHANASAGLVDPAGTILYAKNESLIGVDVFGSRFQSLLPASLKESFNQVLNQSLSGNTGFEDFSLDGVRTTIAYQPVMVNSSVTNLTAKSRKFAILFILEPDVLRASQASQIAFQGELSTIMILGIAASSLVAAVIVLRWNNSLDEAVKKKTAELVSTNNELDLALSREKRNRNRAELLQDILTHDIRNHNQVTRMAAELLGERIKDDPYSEKMLEQLLTSIDRSTQLAENAKRLGRVMSEEGVNLYPVDLMKKLEESLELITSANLGKKTMVHEWRNGIGVSLNRNEIRSVFADDLLGNVFENVYSNAVKYTDYDTVFVGTTIEKEIPYWKISISDRGRGIEDARKDQVSRRYLSSEKGSGLGMSIVHSLGICLNRSNC